MQYLLGAVEQSIGMLGFVISILIDTDLLLGWLHGMHDRAGLERIARPVAIFFVALLVCKVVVWII